MLRTYSISGSWMNDYVTFVEWYRQEKAKVLKEKPAPRPLCPLQISCSGQALNPCLHIEIWSQYLQNMKHKCHPLNCNIDGNDVNKIFNSFLNIFLRIYYTSFPLVQAESKMNQNSWITPGIITSCKRKRELHKELQNNNNGTLASYYKDYTKILSMVIKKAKITEHDKLILNSHNKVKTTWGIINKESGRNKKKKWNTSSKSWR